MDSNISTDVIAKGCKKYWQDMIKDELNKNSTSTNNKKKKEKEKEKT